LRDLNIKDFINTKSLFSSCIKTIILKGHTLIVKHSHLMSQTPTVTGFRIMTITSGTVVEILP